MGELLDFLLNSVPQFRKARLPSLYSDFTLLRSSNPDGYAANISAWLSALQQATQAGKLSVAGNGADRLSLTVGEELLQALETREHGRPLALASVIVDIQDEAVSKGQMMPYDKFQTNPYSIYDRRWKIQPTWMLSWILKQLGVWDPAQSFGKLPHARYAMIANIEGAADQVLKKMSARINVVDRIMSRDSFRQLAAAAIDFTEQLSPNDTDLLLTFMRRDKKAISYDHDTVKFRGPQESQDPITDHDRTIASLKTLLHNLKLQTSHLETRIVSLSQKAAQAVQAKNKPSALAALKSKKLAEMTLTQRHTTLSQLEEIYTKIEEAADQVTLVRVMEGSTGVLHSLHAQTGGIEKVQDIVEDLTEEMTKVDEIGVVINEAGITPDAMADEDLDEELQAMEEQQRQKEKRREEAEKEKGQERKEAEERRRTEEETKQQQQQQRAQDLEERAKKFGLIAPGNERADEEHPAPSKEAKVSGDPKVDQMVRTTSSLSLEDGRIPIVEQ